MASFTKISMQYVYLFVCLFYYSDNLKLMQICFRSKINGEAVFPQSVLNDCGTLDST